MRIFREACAGAVIVSMLYATTAMAAERPIRFQGCVVRGVEHGCLMVRSQGRTYNITAATPKPDPGRGLGIAGTGLSASSMSYCMQGTILKNVRWRYTRQRCPVVPARRATHR